MCRGVPKKGTGYGPEQPKASEQRRQTPRETEGQAGSSVPTVLANARTYSAFSALIVPNGHSIKSCLSEVRCDPHKRNRNQPTTKQICSEAARPVDSIVGSTSRRGSSVGSGGWNLRHRFDSIPSPFRARLNECQCTSPRIHVRSQRTSVRIRSRRQRSNVLVCENVCCHCISSSAFFLTARQLAFNKGSLQLFASLIDALLMAALSNWMVAFAINGGI